jgi:release factor glutamine methyltransferase
MRAVHIGHAQLFSLVRLWYRVVMKRLRMSQEIQWLLEEKYQGRLTPSAKKDVAKLQKGEHVDYVIGFVNFLGCRIDLSKKPFIPRPETEYWVERAIKHMEKEQLSFPRPGLGAPRPGLGFLCLDMFAGSGCIGVAVLKHIPRVHVDFGEKDKRLLSQIRLNAKKNGIKKAWYRVIRTDIFSSLKGKYDYIFANPPYIAESKKSRVQSSVLKHESREALFAGKDGLDAIRLFLDQVKDFLAPGGKVYLEFDSFQKLAIDRYLKRIGYQSWQFFKDQYGKWRFVVIHT